MKTSLCLAIALLPLGWVCTAFAEERSQAEDHKQISGIYPHLAYFNDGSECGTGAVVPWADRLWVITYSPHQPGGSTDKLYEITADLQITARSESVGGTPANRMIHRESNHLLIGPYVIDSERNVRVIPPDKMFGRLTGNARHLTDPTRKIYYATMEEGFYEVDLQSLEVTELFRDNQQQLSNDTEDNSSAERPFSQLARLSRQGALFWSIAPRLRQQRRGVPRSSTSARCPVRLPGRMGWSSGSLADCPAESVHRSHGAGWHLRQSQARNRSDLVHWLGPPFAAVDAAG